VFSGHQPYHSIKAAALMRTILAGTKPFSQLTDLDEIQQYAQRCLSRNSEDRPVIAHIVDFLWEQTNIAETMKSTLSKLAVNQISAAFLTKCDRHADDVDVFSVVLKCKLVHEAGMTAETEVSVFVWTRGIVHTTSVDRSRSRL
jgi:hypothetical protein